VHLGVKDDLVEVNHQDQALNDRMVVVVDDENVDVTNSVVVDHRLHYDVINEDYDVVDQTSSFA
jgi:hypothetical protein